MTGNIKLPSEVANAIEKFRNAEYSDFGIVAKITTDTHTILENERKVLRDWTYGDQGGNANRLLDALRIGYEVELTFKVGEWVITGRGVLGEYLETSEGVYIFNLANGGIGKSDNLRHATPEEIKAEKERRIWAKVGRGVGEFRKGDVGVYAGGTATRASSLNDTRGIGVMYKNGSLDGFYPAESFISFEEESQ